MATRKQIDANRRNAAKSTGPRTPEGKHHSSWNALKHGMAADRTVLPHEDPAAYDQIRADLVTAWQPAGAQELLLVDQIARGAWRMQRSQRLETALFQAQLRILKHNHNLEPAPSALDDEALAVSMLNPLYAPGYKNYFRYDSRAESTFYRALDRLRQLQNDRLRRTQSAPTKSAEPAPTYTELASFCAGAGHPAASTQPDTTPAPPPQHAPAPPPESATAQVKNSLNNRACRFRLPKDSPGAILPDTGSRVGIPYRDLSPSNRLIPQHLTSERIANQRPAYPFQP